MEKKEKEEMPECPFERFIPSELLRDDEYYMKLAYNEGLKGWKENEVPIGAVVVYKGQVVGAAHNKVEGSKDPTAHAEVLAITQAANAVGDWRLNNVELYVTKEPCPMCSGAIIMGRVGRVVYGTRDEKMGCMGSATALHELPRLNHRVEVEAGVLEEECTALLQAFFKIKRN